MVAMAALPSLGGDRHRRLGTLHADPCHDLVEDLLDLRLVTVDQRADREVARAGDVVQVSRCVRTQGEAQRAAQEVDQVLREVEAGERAQHLHGRERAALGAAEIPQGILGHSKGEHGRGVRGQGADMVGHLAVPSLLHAPAGERHLDAFVREPQPGSRSLEVLQRLGDLFRGVRAEPLLVRPAHVPVGLGTGPLPVRHPRQSPACPNRHPSGRRAREQTRPPAP